MNLLECKPDCRVCSLNSRAVIGVHVGTSDLLAVVGLVVGIAVRRCSVLLIPTDESEGAIVYSSRYQTGQKTNSQ